MIVATAGHIDHGKTTLIKALTGVDTTHLPEERRRGMTIDLGFASLLASESRTIAFVDVPGHERFVRTMVAGVSGVDMALLVVAADDGPMPQTREHLQILDLLQIPRCAVAITKIDCACEERVAEVEKSIVTLLAATTLANSPTFRVDAVTGTAVDALREYLVGSSSSRLRARPGLHFRMPIDRSFHVAGAGLVVTGTVAAGHVSLGDDLKVLPSQVQVRVRGLQTHLRSVEQCGPGERCAINIAGPGLDRALIGRGDWIVGSKIAVMSDHLEVKCKTPAGVELRDNVAVHFCHGAGRVPARLVLLTTADDSSVVYAHIVLAEPIHALARDKFILRDVSDTRNMGGGVVLNPFPPVWGYRRRERRDLVVAHDTTNAAEAVAEILRLSQEGLHLGRFAQAWNMDAEESVKLWQQFDLLKVDGFGFARRRLDSEQAKLLAQVDLFQHEHPGSDGLLASDLIGTEHKASVHGLRSTALEALVRERRLIRNGARYRRPEQQSNLSSTDQKLWIRMASFLEQPRPMTVSSIARELNMPPNEVDQFLRRAMKADLVRRILAGRYFPKAAFIALAALAERLGSESPQRMFDVASFRDHSGLGRNLAIEVLEHFDHIGLTRRIGARRMTIKPAASIVASVT
jgi:selenocysteine-specific elongation factor